MEKENGYSHILKYTSLFGGIQGLVVLVSIVRNKLVAMLLGPMGMGLISIFNSTIQLFSNSTNLGLPISAVKKISEAYDDNDDERMEYFIKVMRSWCLLTALLGMALCVALSPLLDKFSFSWGNHTLHFMLLSPVVGIMAITNCEGAVLKGTRQLAKLAKISVYHVLAVLVVTVPLYYYFGQLAIVPSLIIMALIQMLLTIGYSYVKNPPRFSFSRKVLGDGIDVVKLGLAFVAAGVIGSGAEYAIRSYMNKIFDLDTVGQYNAGYMVIMTCASVFFSSLESDYFPRLSTVVGRKYTMTQTINRQIEVSVLIVSPFVSAFIIFLPLIIPFLYSYKFLPAISMMQIGGLCLFIRAMRLPIEYIPLAKGDSKSYFFLEAIYDILLVLLMFLAVEHYGLFGAGLALFLAGIFDLFVVLLYANIQYRYKLSRSVIIYILLQFPCCFASFVIAWIFSGPMYWTLGMFVVLVSFLISLNILRSKTRLWAKIISKFK